MATRKTNLENITIKSQTLVFLLSPSPFAKFSYKGSNFKPSLWHRTLQGSFSHRCVTQSMEMILPFILLNALCDSLQ